MDTLSVAYESLRLNAILRIADAEDAFDDVGKPEAGEAYVARYNAIIEA
jgi:hypothetical protein